MSTLKRELGVSSATMLGLGSILGTGVFVSIALGASIAGPGVIIAIALAACVATCNALSSAQLAAAHPVSGGTYEYGYTYLRPWIGFTAGWMFLSAKSASAATAALGFAGYLLYALASAPMYRTPVAIVTVVLVVIVVLLGLRRASAINTVIVSITVLSLLAFVGFGIPGLIRSEGIALSPVFPVDNDGRVAIPAMLQTTALMFVAYTGYGRIATMGEEVREPRRTIPKAIVSTLVVSAALYIAVAVVFVGMGGLAIGVGAMAPLEAIAGGFEVPQVKYLVALGAITAMLGVLLNLVLGLSRVVLAMGRRGDMPRALGTVDAKGNAPVAATIVVGVVVIGLAAIGSVKVAWSFSAFTVLVYYAITNAAALRLPEADRLYPRAFAWAGLFSCASLAWFVEPRIWLTGTGLLALGLAWHAIARRRR
ncbi:MAG: APC family permease, partial [Planctomycetota bacterium]